MKKLLPLVLPLLMLCFSCSKEKKIGKAAPKMQQFVIDISNYARGLKSNFIIIPQNGVELAYLETDPDAGINESYVAAINGMGVEELFYNGGRVEDDGRLGMLQPLKTRVKVMVADYVADNNSLNDAIQLARNEGFICFPRVPSNYDYLEIPSVWVDENADSINTLPEARNYLYIINTDGYATKQDMLLSIANTNFDVVIVDLFFNGEIMTPAEVSQLKTKANGGSRLAIAYINIGAAENWRYYWQGSWKLHHPGWLKKKYDGYDDEIWVEFWDPEWQDIIFGNDGSYIKKIVDAGFDGAYLDNTEAYYFLYKN